MLFLIDWLINSIKTCFVTYQTSFYLHIFLSCECISVFSHGETQFICLLVIRSQNIHKVVFLKSSRSFILFYGLHIRYLSYFSIFLIDTHFLFSYNVLHNRYILCFLFIVLFSVIIFQLNNHFMFDIYIFGKFRFRQGLTKNVNSLITSLISNNFEWKFIMLYIWLYTLFFMLSNISN